jgi:hypothetical protein
VLELVSDAGTQRAVQGSYCVTGPESGECGGVLGLVVDTTAPLEVRPAGGRVACETR